jgi:hypothetical protein
MDSNQLSVSATVLQTAPALQLWRTPKLCFQLLTCRSRTYLAGCLPICATSATEGFEPSHSHQDLIGIEPNYRTTRQHVKTELTSVLITFDSRPLFSDYHRISSKSSTKFSKSASLSETRPFYRDSVTMTRPFSATRRDFSFVLSLVATHYI